MQLIYRCPGCQQTSRVASVESLTQLSCKRCGWKRPIRDRGSSDSELEQTCLACGCRDLWRQKDFPQKLGLALVVIGAALSTYFYANYMPIISLGVLLAFALGDLLLYTCLKDVRVCYRCGARYGQTNLTDDTPYFNLELAERYRQEAQRLNSSPETEQSAR